MASELKPIRRVVTGNDAQGRSRVLWDGPAPNVNPRAVSPGAGMTDMWVFDRCPAIVSGERDDGNLPFNFEPPEHGGHLRIVPRDHAPDRLQLTFHQRPPRVATPARCRTARRRLNSPYPSGPVDDRKDRDLLRVEPVNQAVGPHEELTDRSITKFRNDLATFRHLGK